MMWLYGFLIRCYGAAVRIAAICGNRKAKEWVAGRKNWQIKLKSAMTSGENWAWFHCASLGEFEQGRPLIEMYRKHFPEESILLTFFSPSGYEHRKNYPGADHVSYLPLDTPSNAKEFIGIVNPKRVFFIKYEYWFNVLSNLQKHSVPLYLVSGIFRPDQWIFSRFGKNYLKRLTAFKRFFVQNEESARLLSEHGFNNVTVAGDTRFDRVVDLADKPSDIPGLENWIGSKAVIVAGSTWPGDEKALLEIFNRTSTSVRLILVPHEVDEYHLKNLEKLADEICPSVARSRFSQNSWQTDADIVIIDRIGMLSKLYRYATITYVGGGFDSGIHNTLEAAVYGKPVVFGPRYRKFHEAIELIMCGAAFSCVTAENVSETVVRLIDSPELLISAGTAARTYVQSGTGATSMILDTL